MSQQYPYLGTTPLRAESVLALDVEHSFVPLLRWILSWWSSQEKSLVLAADASTLGQRFTLLVISVVNPWLWNSCSLENSISD